MISLEEMKKIQSELFAKASSLVEKKGHDYNFHQQLTGDTLFNLRVAKLLGITENELKSVLVRLCDKLMRLISFSDPRIIASVKDESVEDTVVDILNYATFYYAFYKEKTK